jgi:transcriptional regulator with XRE-family HTH domain
MRGEVPAERCTDRAPQGRCGPRSLDRVDNRVEVREFLVSRRAKVTPEQAGLPAGGRRRVPGLRRSEVAGLAGMSVEYYSKLERGSLAGASASVLGSIARALQLDDAERAHLFDLARAADGTSAIERPSRRRSRPAPPRASLQRVLDAVTDGPAFTCNGRMDILATNALARAFYDDLFANPDNRANLARFAFLDPASRDFYADWGATADITVAMLRTEAGRDPHDRDLHDLVGELSTRSEEFATRWGTHDVRHHGTGAKHFHHRVVGDLDLTYEVLALVAEPGLTITIYTAEPATTSHEALGLLASWAATTARTDASPIDGGSRSTRAR